MALRHFILAIFQKQSLHFLAYIEKEPNHNTIHAYLAEAYLGLKQFEKALNAINSCIQLEGLSFEHRLDLRIKILMSLGRFEEAEKDRVLYEKYNQMMNERGNDPNYYMYR